MGGLGLKKTRVMNQAMLAKTGWRMVQNDTGLWNLIFRKKYNLSSSFPQNYHKPAAVSNSWSSVIHGTKLLCKGLKWKLGDGTFVKFWKDVWTNFGPLLEHAVNSSNFNANAWVCDFWFNRSWNIPMLSEQLPPSIVDYIVAIPIPLVETTNKITWSASPDGKFSVKSTYLLNFHDQIPPAQLWSKIWKLHIPPRMKVFLWTMAADKLFTNVQRMHRKFTSDPSCFHCPGTPETPIHLFKDCPKAKMAWNSIHASHISSSYAPGNWHDWFHFNLQQITCLSISIPWNIAFTFICWHIWKWRCKCIFDSSFNLPHDMRSIITTYIEEWTSANRKNHKHWTKSTIMLQWDKPPPGTLKINVDGSHNSRGHIGAGGILRDNSGHWCSGFTVNLGTGDTDQA